MLSKYLGVFTLLFIKQLANAEPQNGKPEVLTYRHGILALCFKFELRISRCGSCIRLVIDYFLLFWEPYTNLSEIFFMQSRLEMRETFGLS